MGYSWFTGDARHLLKKSEGGVGNVRKRRKGIHNKAVIWEMIGQEDLGKNELKERCA